MKLKIPKGFNKWLQMIELNAKYFMWVFGMVLATATVVNILDILTPNNRLILLISLILFFFAGLIVFISDLQRSKQKSAEIPSYTEHSGRNKWISIGLVVLVVIVIGLIFVARQLPPNPQGYQTFFIAFAGIGAWVTGIALAVFAYQQYKLRQTEHRLLFEPQIVLTSGDTSINGLFNKREPYRIKWTVFVQNTSQIPILIQHMQVNVRLLGEDSGRQTNLTPLYCHVIEPASLTMPFEVTRDNPQRLVWIVEGSSAGDVFDYVSGDSSKRDFELIFQVFARMSHDPQKPIFSKETISWGIHVPKNANWASKAPFLDVLKKQG